MNDKGQILITLGGDCFEVRPQGVQRPVNRDGVLRYFYLIDKVKDRPMQRVSVYRGGARDFYVSNVAEFDRRIDMVLLNRLRRAVDSGEITFDASGGATYREISLQPTDFQPQPPASDVEIRQFMMHEAYWLGFRLGERYAARQLVQFDSEGDLEYLGVDTQVLRRNQWLLEEDGLLEKSGLPGSGVPTSALVKAYEARQSAPVGTEQVYPKGTQYEAFKAIKKIFLSATKEILIVDNYLDESVLDMLESLPTQPHVRMLTSKTPKDFKLAVTKFVQQYQNGVEVKLHGKEIHDRAIVIDDKEFYALGASIKDLGNKLSLINKLMEPGSVSKLHSELQTIWASAHPL